LKESEEDDTHSGTKTRQSRPQLLT